MMTQYENVPVFQGWTIEELIGKGGFGTVYRIVDGSGRRAAMKVIKIPSGQNEINEVRRRQPNERAVYNYYYKRVQRIRTEIDLLQKMRGKHNIVEFYGYQEIQNPTGIGWTILIGMELLSPIENYLSDGNRKQADVILLWADIINALVLCEREGIIHRDIKPANIMMDANGNFKLTDFGVARAIDKNASTFVGTERYMAPEVYKGENYDRRADVYSLARVIYYYLNKKKHAFVPDGEVTYADLNVAESRRLRGDEIPTIRGLDSRVNALLKRCLSNDPAERCRDLVHLQLEVNELLGIPSLGTTYLYGAKPKVMVDPGPDSVKKDSLRKEKPPKKEKSSGKKAIVIISVLLACVLSVSALFLIGNGRKLSNAANRTDYSEDNMTTVTIQNGDGTVTIIKYADGKEVSREIRGGSGTSGDSQQAEGPVIREDNTDHTQDFVSRYVGKRVSWASKEAPIDIGHDSFTDDAGNEYSLESLSDDFRILFYTPMEAAGQEVRFYLCALETETPKLSSRCWNGANYGYSDARWPKNVVYEVYRKENGRYRYIGDGEMERNSAVGLSVEAHIPTIEELIGKRDVIEIKCETEMTPYILMSNTESGSGAITLLPLELVNGVYTRDTDGAYHGKSQNGVDFYGFVGVEGTVKDSYISIYPCETYVYTIDNDTQATAVPYSDFDLLTPMPDETQSSGDGNGSGIHMPTNRPRLRTGM